MQQRGDAGDDVVRSSHRDAGRRPHRAAGAVPSDHVPGGHDPFSAGQVAKGGARTVWSALEADQRRPSLDALYDRLRAAPAEPVSVEEVAQSARVSRSTIYLVFGSRSGLFDALTDRLLKGAGYDRIAEAVRHPDARETLRGGLEGGVRMYAAHHDVLRVLYAAGKLDPDGAGRAIAHSERRRFESMGWIANRLHEQEQLRPGVTPDHAAHVIWLLASFDAYDLLASGRGLDPEAVIDVLTDTADHALLSQTG